MTYRVTIDYKRGPAFSTTANATSEEEAIALAKAFARGCGFDAPVAKATAVPDHHAA